MSEKVETTYLSNVNRVVLAHKQFGTNSFSFSFTMRAQEEKFSEHFVNICLWDVKWMFAMPRFEVMKCGEEDEETKSTIQVESEAFCRFSCLNDTFHRISYSLKMRFQYSNWIIRHTPHNMWARSSLTINSTCSITTSRCVTLVCCERKSIFSPCINTSKAHTRHIF